MRLRFFLGIVLAVLFILLAAVLNAQVLKHRRNRDGEIVRSFFEIKRKGLKDSLYVEYDAGSGDTLLIGYYRAGEPVGTWWFRCRSGSFRYSFDSLRLYSDSCSFFRFDSSRVPRELAAELNRIDRPAVFLGYEGALARLVVRSVRLPYTIVSRGIRDNGEYVLHIGSNGRVTDVRIRRPLHRKFDEALKHFFLNDSRVRFIPAFKGGCAVESVVLLIVYAAPRSEQAKLITSPFTLFIPIYY